MVRSLTLIIAVLMGTVFLFCGCATTADKPAGKTEQPAPASPEAKGKALFEDPKLGGGTSGKSCASCHPGGKGLEGIAEKKEYRAMGRIYTSLESITNYFIVTAQLGKGLDPKSEEMQALVAYMKSLKK